MQTLHTAALALATTALAASAGVGQTLIVGQDFDAIGPAYTGGNPATNSDMFPIGTVAAPLTNPGAAYDGTTPLAGGGLPFATTWTDTRGNIGPVQDTNDSGDFIGANSFSGFNAPIVNPFGVAYSFPGGQYNYELNDADGQLNVDFAPVDVSAAADPYFSTYFWAYDTDWEISDRFAITLSDELGNSVSLLDINGFGADDSMDPADRANDGGFAPFVTGDDARDSAAGWNLVTVPLTGTPLTGSQITASFLYDSSSGSENVFLDNISFTDGAVPEPASLGLLGLAGLTLVRRRRA